ncbi:Tbingi protein [Trypanosoma theileri]|uniref:Tbingi protein n=1 Tax=Trypanosoma theileri TaxID=67003 RepID=A0A1X0NLA9_9TRYP|nr:Tbingi protein [Trypanosoma theileri]ORC85361.1 Tbingi protein [Trypanosoma theileri]
MSRHGYQPIRAHTSQRDECDETALHLLSCPALHPLRVQFTIVDDIPLKKLCFSKRLAQFLIAVERNYAMPQTSRQEKPYVAYLPHLSKISDELAYGNPDRRVSSRHLSPNKQATK